MAHSIKMRCVFAVTIVTCCVAFLTATMGRVESVVEARGPEERGKAIRILDSDESSLTIEVSVPAFHVEERFEAGEVFHRLKVKAYGYTTQVGKPQIPTKGVLIAVPEGAEVSIVVLESEKVSKSAYHILPVPELVLQEREDGLPWTVEEFTLDRAAYSSRSPYPGSLTEVGFYGHLREVKVVQVKVNPFQYIPATGELIVYERMLIKVNLSGGRFPPRSKGRISVPDPKRTPFETIYRNTILNYDSFDWKVREMRGRSKRSRELEGNREYLSGGAFKVSVEEDGLYELDSQALSEAGIDIAGTDPRTIHMFHLGREIPIFIDGEEDGAFDPADHIEFYGIGNTSEYSSTNVYWLTVDGEYGLRMETRDVSPQHGFPVPKSFLQTRHIEENRRYYSNVFEGEGADHWFWEQLDAPDSSEYIFFLPNVSDTIAALSLTVCLRGKSGTSTNPDHHTQILLNGHLVADFYWDDKFEYVQTVTVPQSHLYDGSNTLKIRCPHDTGSSLDIIFLNWFEIDYWQNSMADEDELRFVDPEPGPNQFQVGQLSREQIEILQITNPSEVVRLTHFSVVPQETTFTVIFEDSLSQEEYLIVTRNKKKTPVSLREDEPSEWRSTQNRADYIIITHKNFYQDVQPLVELREREGLRVAVVKITDIYDEFNDGNVDPQAMKNFLTYAYDHWQQPAPLYVLLVGDATFDYKDYLGTGNINYVPTHLFISQTEYTEISSDHWFVCLVGEDRLPDMLIGRLSGKIFPEIQTMVNKIIGYETDIPEGEWRRKALLIADDPDEGGDFEAVSENLATNYLPVDFDTAMVYMSRFASGQQCKDEIIGQINTGCVFVNYVGHGSMNLWAAEKIFSSDDVFRLANGEKLPLIVTMECLNGFFHHATDGYCLAENFLRASNKGAIACWSHSGLDYTYLSEILGEHLLSAFFFDNDYILGSAIAQAKIEYFVSVPQYWDQAEMYVLFGDPALEMGFPGRPDCLPTDLAFCPPSPVQNETDTVRAVIYNAGREDIDTLKVRFSVGHPDSGATDDIADILIHDLVAGEHTDAQALWNTPEVAGIYQISVSVDPDDHIVESNEWNNRIDDTVEVRSATGVGDHATPTIDLYLDGKTVGTDFQEYDYVCSEPHILAVLKDGESGICTGDIELRLNEEVVDDFSVSPTWNGAKRVELIYTPEQALEDGDYVFTIHAPDNSPRKNCAQVSVAFTVESRMRIKEVTNYPNPFGDQTSFVYSLSMEAQTVYIKIYTVSGRLIKTIDRAPGDQNYNVADWDGRDDDGDRVANGVYLYKVTVTGTNGRDSLQGRLIVMR